MQAAGTQFKGFKDIDGTTLTHQHNAERPMGVSDLTDYQKLMVDESGPRQLNSLQHPIGDVKPSSFVPVNH
jgi:hypothetical protein